MMAGATALKRYWFAFFFLIFMVPLPIALYSKIASPLQLFASRVASTLMTATGLPVLCEGNKMTLPGGLQMFVAEACSGMRQLTGFLALTAAVAYWTKRPPWYRVVIVISALPIALSANIARVMLTGYIMHFVNPAVRARDVPYRRGVAHDGLRSSAASSGVLASGSDLPDETLLARSGHLQPDHESAPSRACRIQLSFSGEDLLMSQLKRAMHLRCDSGNRHRRPGCPRDDESNRAA